MFVGTSAPSAAAAVFVFDPAVDADELDFRKARGSTMINASKLIAAVATMIPNKNEAFGENWSKKPLEDD